MHAIAPTAKCAIATPACNSEAPALTTVHVHIGDMPCGHTLEHECRACLGKPRTHLSVGGVVWCNVEAERDHGCMQYV